MSCAGGGCSERLQKSEIDKWTTSINQMFISEAGRQKFIEFLMEREMEEELVTVQFWEKCEALHKKILSERKPPRNELIKEMHELIDFADENINFSLAEMTSLGNLLHERDTDKLCDILLRAKTSTARLLDGHHKVFSDVILKQYRYRCH